MSHRRVVVTGMGVVTPLGNDVRSYFTSLKSGKSGSATIRHFDTSNLKTKFACAVRGFEPTNYVSAREVRRLDLCSVYAIASSDEALYDAYGKDLAGLDKKRTGVIFASGIGGFKTSADGIVTLYQEGYMSPYYIPKIIVDIGAGLISIRHGLLGLNFATVSACASSNHAIITGLDFIRNNRADCIIVGGSEAAVTFVGLNGFGAMKALSTRNDSPETASRPFDKGRDGFVMGDGAGSLVLEELSHAQKRGAQIYAEVVGGGMSADAYHLTAPHPEGLGAIHAMEWAIQDANIQPEVIDYINTHGTSTPLGDIAEIEALKKVFGDHLYKLNVNSTKSMTGHLLGAASAVEAVGCICAMREGIVPPTINHFEDDDKLDPRVNYTFNEAQARNVGYSLSNSFGFGGHSTAVIFKRWTE